MLWNLCFVFILSIVSCFLPLALNLQFAEPITTDDNIFHAFDSLAFKMTLSACISLSVPLLLEIARDCFLAQSKRIKKNILTNILLVLSLIVPDVIVLAYVIPNRNLRLFMCINQGRTVALISSIYAYFIIFGGQFFQRKIHMSWYISCTAGSVLFAYGSSSSDPLRIQDWISLFLTLFSMGIVIMVSFEWFRNQRLLLSSENRHLTTDEYCINIYIIASILCFCGLILAWVAYGSPRFSQMNSGHLIITNIFYALYYVVISVFQGGAVRRQEIIENSMKVKKKFIRYISHEIRTPLNAVSLGLKYLYDVLPKYVQDPDILDSIVTSQSACTVSVNILTDLLTFDKIEDGDLKLDRSEVAVKDLVLSATAIFQAQAREKEIALITEIALEPRTLQGMSENGRLENNWEGRSGKSLSHLSMGGEVKAYVDRAKMSQVIHNLVSNGLKFTPPGGRVTVTVTLEEECMLSSPTPRGFSYTSTPLQGKNDGVSGGPARPPMWVKITVTDTGVGLSQENMKKLFKAAIQFNPEVLQAGGGSGLGLFISKSILDAHGGTITVDSNGEMRGCTFTVTFPAISSDSANYSSEVSPVGVCLPGGKEGNKDGKVHEENEEEKDMSPISILASALQFGRTLKLKSQLSGRMGGWPAAHVHPSQSREQSAHVLARMDTLSSGSVQQFQELGVINIDRDEDDQVFSSSLETNTKKWLKSMRSQERHQHEFRPVPTPTNALATIAFVADVEQQDTRFISDYGLLDCVSNDQYDSSPISGDILDEKKDDDGAKRSGGANKLPRVLIVDDAKSNRKMLCRVLRSRCSVIVEADDGQKAVDIVKQSMVASAGPLSSSSPLFDLILMDFVMPVMDGPTAIMEIRKLGYIGLIFGLTGNVLDSDKDLMIANGANFVLTKPFNMDAFDEALLEYTVGLATANDPSAIAGSTNICSDGGEGSSNPRKIWDIFQSITDARYLSRK